MNLIKSSSFTTLYILTLVLASNAQDLDQLMSQTDEKKKEYTYATFKGTKVLNSHSIEGLGKGVLQVMFQHRFSPLENGIYDFFGLDGASIRFGFEYGINNRLTVGIGRASQQKAYDGYFKYKLLRQSTGPRSLPFSLSLFGSTAIRSQNFYNSSDEFNYRLFYTSQLIIARKFSPSFSLQLMPTFIHRNLTDSPSDANNLFALGIAFRQKLTKRFGIVGEYYYTFTSLDSKYQSSVAALGLEIETGGHVYHLLFTNSPGVLEPQFIGNTRGSLSDGLATIRFGFNLSRVFTVVKYND
jgi:hypothetical protein